MLAKQYPLTLQANETQAFDVTGSFFKFLSISGTNNLVRVKTESGAVMDLGQGQGIKNFPYKRLILTNLQASAVDLLMLVADGELIDPMQGIISISSVATLPVVRDPWWNFGALGQAYAGGAAMVLPANMGHIQIWNPPGSARNYYISEVDISCMAFGISGATSILSFHNASIGTLLRKVPSIYPTNPDSDLEVRTLDQSTVISGVSVIAEYVWISSMPTGEQKIKFDSPLTLPPGYGLLLRASTGGISTSLNVRAGRY